MASTTKTGETAPLQSRKFTPPVRKLTAGHSFPFPNPLVKSPGSSPQLLRKETSISVSTTFYPGAQLFPFPNKMGPCDVVLNSIPDSVYFYAHSDCLLRGSANSFNSLLPLSARRDQLASPGHHTIIDVPETADILNIVLHALYQIPAERYAPSLDTLSNVLPTLVRYGYNLDDIVSPGSEISRLILYHAHANPLRVYILAASYSIEHIAVAASRHVASIAAITEVEAIAMGSLYLHRLICLHLNRMEALKRILLVPPQGHPPPASRPCDGTDQKVRRAWALATAYLAWEARPIMPSIEIAQSLAPLLDHVQCIECKANLQHQISSVLNSWAHVKDTI
ncbi:hypothetical protein BS47DRAFT_1291759 [Hydnum rufescens UP504]|uniref:BTB domain-containing protein n=1 Tax=Hydnum rufescens UP504 TaxID=1448309 RepID=A0A9P6B3T0_9AGAM|nr:hypothetical protein BS47DRAFT_1291759 [Hydnum rufescens UP504]